MAQMQATGGSFVMLAQGNRSAQVTETCRTWGGVQLGSMIIVVDKRNEFFAETAKPVVALTIGSALVQPRWPGGPRLG